MQVDFDRGIPRGPDSGMARWHCLSEGFVRFGNFFLILNSSSRKYANLSDTGHVETINIIPPIDFIILRIISKAQIFSSRENFVLMRGKERA